MDGPTKDRPTERPTDRIEGAKEKRRDRSRARPSDLCEMVIMLTAQDCVGSGGREGKDCKEETSRCRF